MDLHKAFGQRRLAIGLDTAVGDMRKPRTGDLNDPPAGIAQAGIDPDDSHDNGHW